MQKYENIKNKGNVIIKQHFLNLNLLLSKINTAKILVVFAFVAFISCENASPKKPITDQSQAQPEIDLPFEVAVRAVVIIQIGKDPAERQGEFITRRIGLMTNPKGC